LEITTESAFSILDYYRRTGTRLEVGGKILGEIAAAAATVTEVQPELHSVTVRILSHTDEASWGRMIPLRGASFSFIRSGDNWPLERVGTNWRSVLLVDFPDGTMLFFADSEIGPWSGVTPK
jgi:hypothetical protein